MYPNAKKYSVALMTTIAVLTCIVCVVTLFSPWIHIGLPMENGRYLDANRAMDDLLDVSVEDILEELDDLGLDDFEYLSPKEAKKQIRTTKKAVTEMVEILEDSKLTPAETASLCSNVRKLCDCLVELDIASKEDIPTLVLTVSSVLLWVFLAAIVLSSVYGIYAALTGKKQLTLLTTILYGLLFLAFAALTITVNLKAEEVLEELWYLSHFDFTSLSVLRLRAAPFLGFVLLIASLILQAKVPAFSGKLAVSAMSHNAGAGLFWTCSCGATNRNSAAFCPKCGSVKVVAPRPVPEASHWLCVCGNQNSRKVDFCPRCGSPRPVRPAPVQPVVSVRAVDPVPPTVPVPPVAPEQTTLRIEPTAPAQTDLWTCADCGTVVSDPTARFCPNCGHARELPKTKDDDSALDWENF